MLQVMEVFIPHMEDAVGEHLRSQTPDSMTTPVYCDDVFVSQETQAPKLMRGISCPCAWW